MKNISAFLLVAALLCGSAACTNMSRTQQGVLSGTAGGALVGAGISSIAGGSGTMGALVGGGLGAIAGGVYGHQKSKGAW
ncbi:MAG: cell envelope biogenesis protein OmpA [Bilophila sp.]